MEVNKTTNRIHPLVAAASVSVMLVSLVGVAAITGVLPTSHGTPPAATPVAAMSAPAETAAPSSAVSTASVPKPVMPTESKLAATDEAPAPAKPAARPAVKPKPAPTHASTAHTSSPNYSAKPNYAQQAPVYTPPPTQVAQAPAPCYSCGRVESVHTVQSQAAPSGLGAVAGGVVGGLLGNQVGGGNGKTLATVAGAVGGGFAGHEIEKRTRAATTYQVRVRMEDGTVRSFPYDNQPNWSVGDRVKVVDGYLTARG